MFGESERLISFSPSGVCETQREGLIIYKCLFIPSFSLDFSLKRKKKKKKKREKNQHRG